jgi:hypothetical protein
MEVSIVDMGANDDAIQLNYRGKDLKLTTGISTVLPKLKLHSNNQKTDEMKTIALKLGLPESATEGEVLSKLTQLQDQAGKAAELSKKVEQITLSSITALVDTAVQDKRIVAGKKDHFIELGKAAGMESLKETLALMTPSNKPSDFIGAGKSGSQGSETSTYKKLSEVPAQEVLQLRSDNPEAYKELFKAEYGFIPELEK